MSIALQNIKELDVHGDDWRAEFNGEEYKEYQVDCHQCGNGEEESEMMYVFDFMDAKFILCDRCLSQVKTTLLEVAV